MTTGLSCDGDQNTPILEENGPDKFKGIDIMRAVRSFDPCLPCGVHMYLGNGKVIKEMHSPTALGSEEVGKNELLTEVAYGRRLRPQGTACGIFSFASVLISLRIILLASECFFEKN